MRWKKREECKHAHWVQEPSWKRLYTLQCELGQCPCIDDACLFYEEEKDEDTETISAEDDK